MGTEPELGIEGDRDRAEDKAGDRGRQSWGGGWGQNWAWGPGGTELSLGTEEDRAGDREGQNQNWGHSWVWGQNWGQRGTELGLGTEWDRARAGDRAGDRSGAGDRTAIPAHLWQCSLWFAVRAGAPALGAVLFSALAVKTWRRPWKGISFSRCLLKCLSGRAGIAGGLLGR